MKCCHVLMEALKKCLWHSNYICCHALMEVQIVFMLYIERHFTKLLLKTLRNGKQWQTKFKMAAITCRSKYIHLKLLVFYVTVFVQSSLHVYSREIITLQYEIP